MRGKDDLDRGNSDERLQDVGVVSIGSRVTQLSLLDPLMKSMP